MERVGGRKKLGLCHSCQTHFWTLVTCESVSLGHFLTLSLVDLSLEARGCTDLGKYGDNDCFCDS
jgi:hypothetical protein